MPNIVEKNPGSGGPATLIGRTLIPKAGTFSTGGQTVTLFFLTGTVAVQYQVPTQCVYF